MFLERKPDATISFTDIVQLMGGGTPKTEEDSFWNGDILFFTPKDVSHSPFCISTEKHLTVAGLNNLLLVVEQLATCRWQAYLWR